MRNVARTLVVLSLGALVALPASPASAHESREVGDHTFVVGWYDEPAFANSKNGPEVTITHQGKDPVVEGVELEVEIGFEGETVTLPLEPAFLVGVYGDPGNYNADIYPTRPGTYTFHITGSIEGEPVDETFTSGPDTFGDIEDPNEVAFPVKDPSIAELADEVDQVAAVVPAETDDSSANTIGYIGIAVGAVGLIVAIAALRRKRTA